MLATDRDLVVFEPDVFREVLWVSQRVVKGVGAVSGVGVGAGLTLTSQDVNFENAGVGAGNVVLVGGTTLEVIARLTPVQVAVSRPRGALGGGTEAAVITPAAVVGAEVIVPTFGPQIRMVSDLALRMLGIEPEDSAGLTEANLVNAGALTRFVCLGVLHAVYSAAAALGPSQGPLAVKAAGYRERFATERGRVAVQIDTDGDGVADALRRLNVVQFVRG